MTTPSAEERAAWRALAEGATPGEWVALGNTIGAVVKGCTCGDGGPNGHEQYCGLEGPVITGADEADATFIAAAREGWPRTLDALDEAEERAHAVSCELIRQATEGITAERDMALSMHRVQHERANRMEAERDSACSQRDEWIDNCERQEERTEAWITRAEKAEAEVLRLRGGVKALIANPSIRRWIDDSELVDASDLRALLDGPR